jgi:hypothetical protein
MRYIAVILVAILFFGCSPSKKLQRLLDKHPELSRVDTVTVAIPVPPDTIHEAVVIRLPGDTVTIENERQVVRIVRIPTGSPCDTASIALDLLGVLKPDTVYTQITVDRVVPCPEKSVASWWRTAALFFGALVLALLLLIRYGTKGGG